LLLRKGLGSFREALQKLLDAGNVVGRLGEGPRVLLDGGVTIELEGIELAAVLRAFVIVLVQDLRLGLDLETAQLLLEARHRARQLAQVEIERAELLLEAGARNTRFARDVEELIEELGINARHLLALPACPGLAPRRHRWRRKEAFLRVPPGRAGAAERRGGAGGPRRG